jgi:hypothetical protein
VRTAIFILASVLSASVLAVGWGGFSGLNEHKQLITLSPDHNEPSLKDPKVEDIHSLVYVGDSKSQYKTEIKETCHRQTSSTQNRPDIWCDGNSDSPLYGVTYRWKKTIPGPRNEEYSDKEIWLCVSGCNPRAPKEMLYEY